MLRTFFSIIAGFITWVSLLAGTAYLSTPYLEDWRMLSLILAINLFASALAAFTTASLSRELKIQHAIMLSFILIGLFGYLCWFLWGMLPGWFLIIFLMLIFPSCLVGADLRNRNP